MKSILFTLVLFLYSHLAFGQTAIVNPNDQTDIKFNQGSVLVTCGSIGNETNVSTELFNDAFPKLIIALDKYIKDEKLIRAHYLGELKSGVFMVVGGKDRVEAMKNAKAIVEETKTILKESLSNVESNELPGLENSCNYIEIGPIFLS